MADHQKPKVTAKELARLEKQRKLAQTLRLRADAEENGDDLERRKAWEWSIEQNERWEAKMAEQKVRGDSSFHSTSLASLPILRLSIRGEGNAEFEVEHRIDIYLPRLDAEDDANKLYNRNLRSTKPDLNAYERQKELALGLGPGQLATSSSSSSRSRGLTAAEDLYRGADTLSYGDSKPSEDAIDRVVGKINKECVIWVRPGDTLNC